MKSKKLFFMIKDIIRNSKSVDNSIALSAIMQPLEQRLMFDGAALQTVDLADGVSDGEKAQIANAIDSNDQADAADSLKDIIKTAIDFDQTIDYSVYKEVIFIDSRVKDPQTIIQNIMRKASVEIIDIDENGINAIADMLKKYSNLEAIHIISHGNEGTLLLGNETLDNSSIINYQSQLAQWGNALSLDGDILIYGCDVAKGADGLAFVDALKTYTQADIAASIDASGASKLGGDSDLEQKYQIDVSEIINFDGYEHLLAPADLAFVDIEAIKQINGSNDYDAAGSSVALSQDGSIMAIGSPTNAAGGIGSVSVYENVGGIWSQVGQIIQGVPDDQTGFSVSLSADGTILAIGSPDSSSNTGSVAVYQYDGISTWNQLGSSIIGQALGDQNGYRVVLSDDGMRLALSSPNYDDGIILDTGNVRVFEYFGGVWDQMGTDIIPYPVVLTATSGQSLSFSSDGSIVSIGSPRYQVGGNNNAGAVNVYQWDGFSWNQLGASIEGAAAGDFTGYQVSLSSDGQRLAVGTYANGFNASIVIYDFDGFSWNQVGSTINADTNTYDGINLFLSDDGQRLAVQDDSGVAINVYEYNDIDWVQYGTTIGLPPNHSQSLTVGYALALSGDGDFLASGSPENSYAGTNSGSTVVYSLEAVEEALTFTEGDPATVIYPEYSIVDADSTNMISATVSIIGNYALGEDFLDFTPVGAISGLFNSVTGILTLSGSDTKANYEQALASVTYQNTSLTPSTLQRTIEFIVNDGTTDSNSIHALVDVIDIDKVPDLNFVDVEFLSQQNGINNLSEAGSSVAVSDNGLIMAVGAPGDTSSSGSVTVYENIGGFWSQIGNIITGNLGDQAGFNISLNDDGSILAIGSPLSDANGLDSGSVSIYQYDGVSTWNQLGAVIDGQALGDQNGYRVSLSADGMRIAISAPDYDNGSNTNVGNVRIFEYSGVVWSQLGDSILGPNGATLSGLGLSLSANGNTVAIGTPTNNSNAGVVDIYQWNGFLWQQLGSSINDAPGNQSGYSVSLSADGLRLAIGSPMADGSAVDSGAVKVFEWDGSNWNLLGSAIDGFSANANSGTSVSLSLDGTRLAIGAPNDSVTGTARIYEYDGSNWIEFGSDILNAGFPGDDGTSAIKVGYSVDLAGDGGFIVVGSPENDFNGTNTGSAQSYSLQSTQERLIFTEGDSATVIYSQYSIVDDDSVNMSGATISITSNYASGEDFLNFTSIGSISGLYNTVSGVLTLTGLDSISNYQLALASVTYENTSLTPSTLQRTVEFVVSDGVYSSTPITSLIDVIAVDNAPVLDFVSVAQQVQQDGSSALAQAGYSVAVSEDGLIMAVGAPGDASSSGSVIIYENVGGLWSQMGNIITGNIGDKTGFNISLNDDGSILAVGSPLSDANGLDSGSVSIYQYDGVSTWNQLGASINGQALGDESGYQVALSADGMRIALSAPNYDNGSNIDAGNVRVFEYSGGVWTQVGLDIFAPTSVQQSGQSISLSADGDTLAIGSPSDSSGGNTSNGATRVYQWNGSAWYQLGSALNGLADDDASGSSVSLSSDGMMIAIGAPFSDVNGSNSGSVSLYQWNGSNWVQVGSTIQGLSANANSGTSVSLSLDGQRVAIGAPNDSVSGSALIYEYNGSDWFQVGDAIIGASIMGADSAILTGFSVGLSGDGQTIIVGSPNNDVNGTDSGSVGSYSLGSAQAILNYTSGDPAVVIASQYSIMDIDSVNMTSATIAIVNNYIVGEDVLSFSSIGAITGSFDPLTGILTLTGIDTKENYQLALASIAYQNVSDTPSTLQRSVEFFVNDGAFDSNIITSFIDITANNSAYVIGGFDDHTPNYPGSIKIGLLNISSYSPIRLPSVEIANDLLIIPSQPFNLLSISINKALGVINSDIEDIILVNPKDFTQSNIKLFTVYHQPGISFSVIGLSDNQGKLNFLENGNEIKCIFIQNSDYTGKINFMVMIYKDNILSYEPLYFVVDPNDKPVIKSFDIEKNAHRQLILPEKEQNEVSSLLSTSRNQKLDIEDLNGHYKIQLTKQLLLKLFKT